MDKKLYFLHIPKTAGKFISANIKNSLEKNNIPFYISTHYPNNSEFLKSKVYISAHAGTYPINLIDEIDVATIVRDPVSARASYFNFIYPFYLKEREEYSKLNTIREKFLYYLFEDENFLIHNNYQSRFICNPADERSWNLKKFYEVDGVNLMKKYYEGKGFDWFVSDENTSLELAVKNISNFKIKNTMDNIDLFVKNIQNWFMENYKIEVPFKMDTKINVGLTEYNNSKKNSSEVMSLLNNKEVDKLIELNSIDYQIYKIINDEEKNGKK